MTTITNYEMTPGWDAGARSIASLSGDGSASWKVGQAVGIVCGFNNSDEGAHYSEIDHGFFIESGKYCIIESGVIKTLKVSYGTDAVFKIERINGVVRYYLDDVLVYTSIVNSSGIIFVDCSLYAYLDTIIDLVVTEGDAGLEWIEIKGSFETLQGILIENKFNIIRGSFEPINGSLTVLDTAYLRNSFSPLTGKLSESDVSYIQGSFEPLEGKLVGLESISSYIQGSFEKIVGSLIEDQVVYIKGSFEPLTGFLGDDLIPEYNYINGNFSPLIGKLTAYDDPIEISGSFEPITGILLEEGISIIEGSFEPMTGVLWIDIQNQLMLSWPQWTLDFYDSPPIAVGHFSPYGVITARAHRSFYYTEIIGRLHNSSWSVTGTRLHQAPYEVVLIGSATSAQRTHFSPYEVLTAAAGGSRSHLSPYEVVLASSVAASFRSHLSPYEVTGALSGAFRSHLSPYEVLLLSSASVSYRLHESLYEVSGALSGASRTHVSPYEVILLSSASVAYRLHTSPYQVTGSLTGAYRLHTNPYEVILASSTSTAYRLHTSPYSITGALTGAYRLHYNPYQVALTSGVSTNFRTHVSPYQVTVLVWNSHVSSWKTVVTDQRLHRSSYTVLPTVDYEFRLHESRYRVLDVTTTLITDLIYLEVFGVRPDYLNISITADEDSSYWQCEASLRDAQIYASLVRDTPFLVHLLGVDYHFIVDNRSLNRSIDDEGNYVETCTITGLSPLVHQATPRVTPIIKTWEAPIMASSVVIELLGSVTWNLIDWMIPAYRLAAENAAPLDIAQQVVQAAGGLIESQPDGSIVCRHRWPVSIAQLDGTSPNRVLSERVIYSASENVGNDDLINRVRIGQDATFQDRLEYVPNKLGNDEDDPLHGTLYAFPSPWRDELRMVTTRPSVIRVGPMTEGVRSIEADSENYPAEVITFTDREASTQYPIQTVTSFEWLDEDLGSLSITPYSSRVESGSGTYGGHSLGRIAYTARYLAVPITCTVATEEIEAQFLLLEKQNG